MTHSTSADSGIPIGYWGDRLESFPPKVRAAMTDLYKRGHIYDEAMNTIIDAAELSGTLDRCLGFAVAYHSMALKKVPIGDTVRMARRLGRKVNLSWSKKRWQQEHSLLSRAVTLQELSSHLVVFQLDEYREHLPLFPGYLIPTSRRLAMEGFRQAHCVAIYALGIAQGRYAIASVFLDRTRWTVQLSKTCNPAAPLRITQIQKRLGKLPTQKQRSDIAELLGIDESLAHCSPSSDHDEKLDYRARLSLVTPALRELCIEEVTVDFVGYGGSGQVDSIVFVPPIPDGVEPVVRYPVSRGNFVDGAWLKSTTMEEVSLEEAINNIMMMYVDIVPADLVNNDGGQASLVINVVDGAATMDASYNYREKESALLETCCLLTGELVE